MDKRALFFMPLFGILISNLSIFAAELSGGIQKEAFLNKPAIIDKSTDMPISGATVSIPSKNISTQTDDNGRFNLLTELNSDVILSVQKEGYKPMSVTINKMALNSGIKIKIEKQSFTDIIISENLIHIGDDSFSSLSANAGDFKGISNGVTYRTEFFVDGNKKGKNCLVIGSIMGLDTKEANRLKQNNITTAYSAPAQVFINSRKIGELKINGDNQRINIPKNVLNPDEFNVLEIKTGINQHQKAYIDYDDIELMNIYIE